MFMGQAGPPFVFMGQAGPPFVFMGQAGGAASRLLTEDSWDQHRMLATLLANASCGFDT
jgi:hypothetical protein